MKRMHIVVSGRVQGVSFRSETKRAADALSLKGWVRNLQDGRVEAVFEGPNDALQSILAWYRKGPTYARVDDVALTWEPCAGTFTDFKIRY